MAVYFIIVMVPFDFNGAGQPIQNDVRMFDSLYQIIYFQQFLINLRMGYATLLFLTGLTLSVTIFVLRKNRKRMTVDENSSVPGPECKTETRI